MLELYHHGSSACAAKVRLALAEKKLEWLGRYIDILKGEQYAPEYLKLNPKAVVPTLVHDGAVVTESTIICEYLDNVYPETSIYLADPLERARVRAWAKAVDEELHPACRTLTFVASHRFTLLRNGVGSYEEFMGLTAGENLAIRKMQWKWIHEGFAEQSVADQVRLYDAYLHKMDAALSGLSWLAADEHSMADISLTPYVNRLAVLSMEGLWQGGRLPNVESWFDRVRERDSFAPGLLDWMPPDLTEEMRENGKKAWPEIKALLKI